jgi:hypothetical protein
VEAQGSGGVRNGGRKRPTAHALTVFAPQQLATISRVYREDNVIITLFRQRLTHASAVDIVKLHTFCEKVG